MTEKLKQTIKEELAQLPKANKEAIATLDWVKITDEIGKEFLLEENNIESFQLETLLVLIGATESKFYAINIENHVNTTKDKAEGMANVATQKIFTPIHDILEKNIKKDLQNKESGPTQNLNFILSGGDYTFLLEKEESSATPPPSTLRPQAPETRPPTPPTLADIQANAKKRI